eukprot:7869799-Heterocapsa_arctica.AAC.1
MASSRAATSGLGRRRYHEARGPHSGPQGRRQTVAALVAPRYANGIAVFNQDWKGTSYSVGAALPLGATASVLVARAHWAESCAGRR